jgi:2-iminobutanoate/2-iminopropanoate deaminase
MRLCRAALLTALITAGCGSERADAPAVEHFAMEFPAPLPFSAAVRVGPTLYLSGQLGTDSAGRLVPGGIGPETRQTLENIRAVLERAGGTMDDVVKCTVMLADMSDWGAMNREYVTFFPRKLPARSALGASGLALGARVEIECIAVLP